MMLEKGEPCTSQDSTLTTTKKNRKNKNKKRFSDEQIKSMEIMFETETKLEPRTKIKLAKELDLQPRQVAIWFQNRRARWKSKQLERDYNLLKASYDALASEFESINKEKQVLLSQLQKLNELQRKPKQESRWSGDGNSTDDGDSDNGVTKYNKLDQKQEEVSFGGSDLRIAPCAEDENNHSMYLGDAEEAHLMSVMDPANPLLSSSGNWSTFDTNNPLFDQSSSSTSQWWEIWS